MTGPPYLDTLGMWEAAATLPEQLSEALRAADGAFRRAARREAASWRAVAAFGLAAGGTACEAAAALTVRQLPVPFWIGHGTTVPAFVDGATLVLAVSCSGATEQTLAAAEEAAARGATVMAVGGDAGGALARRASDTGFAWCPVAPSGPTARTALGAATVPLLVALSAVGLLPDAGRSVAAAASALARRRDALLGDRSEAGDLARRIGRTIPLLYGWDGIGAVAARWWKAQVNVNAKTPAVAAALPGVAHDELAGWGQDGDVTRQVVSLVLLRHGGEGAQAADLFERVRAATDEVMADVLEVRAEGEDDLSRFFDLALLGEFVSLHMAGREGVDPGPAPALEEAGGTARSS